MRAILFDLDGTLLDVDTERFMERYFAALRAVEVPGFHGDLFAAVMEATRLMMRPHRGITNESVFWDRFLALAGGTRPDFEPSFARFYANEFPTLRESAEPMADSRRAVEAALERGLGVAIATNPMFPRVAIEQRITWAGLGDLIGSFHVTSYENATACKPLPDYFVETAAALGRAPDECLMVGDDADLDLPAAMTGMRTYYVGPDPHAPSELRGVLADLTELILRL